MRLPNPFLTNLILAAFLLTTSAATDAARSGERPLLSLPYDGTLPVEVHLGQQELVVEAQQTNAGAAGGGLLGALIATALDNSMAKKDEVRIGAIRDLLLGAELNGYFLRAFASGLDPQVFAQALEIELHAESRAKRLSRGELGTRERVLEIDLDYAFTADVRALRVSADVVVGPREIKGNREKRTKVTPYRFVVQSLTPLPGVHKKLKEDECAAMWAALGRERLETMLQAAMTEVVQMTNHVVARLPEATASGERVRYRLGFAAAGAGRVDRIEGARAWLRVNAGRLVSVPQ